MQVRRLGAGDLVAFRAMNHLFADVFGELENYSHRQPDDAYAESLLERSEVLLLIAEEEGRVTGAIGGYILPKFEQQRSELFIYDLAVAKDRRREGIASAMIETCRAIARSEGCWTIFVQADVFPEDEPARALYRRFAREEIKAHHFDIAP